MQEVSVIIPNFNGMAYLDGVLAGLECQTVSNFDVILVDNGSNDGSCAFVAARYPWVHLIELPENFGSMLLLVILEIGKSMTLYLPRKENAPIGR